jgi:hypothetical protein
MGATVVLGFLGLLIYLRHLGSDATTLGARHAELPPSFTLITDRAQP